ncbi:MAG: hypothetical protein JRH13_00380 [Deltaproteobacteria bacterium]|nr:hypothetical protein [Deltaproteobacteria bacterium]MBW2015274.1 hypothetical protein [Deltaproteobacteria bacterium]MBW2127806.1 hypothetical protein [Deltaproteobacteria bacterium]MBW2302090.1 hypothetical protein [Deltaproteobacteria bacterium]
MLRYHYCDQCGMFTAKEKERCLYCGADLRPRPSVSRNERHFSFFTSIFSFPYRSKCKKKLRMESLG